MCVAIDTVDNKARLSCCAAAPEG